MEAFIRFLNAIEDDPRIGTSHISIYLVLLCLQHKSGKEVFTIKRHDIMRRAKIRSRHTYNSCMNQLHEYGYIQYHPCSHPSEGSRVQLLLI